MLLMSTVMWRKADWNMCTPALTSEGRGGGGRAEEADVYWVQRCVSVNRRVWGVAAEGGVPAAFKGNQFLLLNLHIVGCVVCFSLSCTRLVGSAAWWSHPHPLHNDQRG